MGLGILIADGILELFGIVGIIWGIMKTFYKFKKKIVAKI